MKLTTEQSSILSIYKESKNNLLIEARAGSGKTFMIRRLAEQTEGSNLYLAFNKSVVEEVRNGLPPQTDVKTFNGIGHKALVDSLGHRPKVVKRKVYDLLKINEPKNFKHCLQAVSISKQQGYVCKSHSPEFYSGLPFILDDGDKAVCDKVIRASYKEALLGNIDFDDQILLPVLEGYAFPQYSVIFVDEAQDLSPMNQRMLRSIAGIAGTRVIAVGDTYQAIYGFRGASLTGMSDLRKAFGMQTLKLTTTFRCAKEIVRHANWLTHDLNPAAEAAEGDVLYCAKHLDMSELALDTALLCRNNAPLIHLAMRMIKRDYAPDLKSKDILWELKAIMQKLEKSGMSIASAIAHWEQEALQTWKSQEAVKDRVECLQHFANTGSAGIKALINQEEGRIPLSTVHKAKGCEWETVVIIDKHLFDMKEKQDKNLLYVAQTRAKRTLMYVNKEKIVLPPII